MGFPKGFPLFAISAVRKDLQRNDGCDVNFLVGFSEDSFNNSAYRLDAFAPPSLRIDIQRDTARAASVPHVVTCNFETSAKASHQASVLGPKAAEVEGCRYSKFPGRCFRMSMKQVMPVERLANFVGKDQVIRLTEFLVAYLQEGWS